MPMPDSGENMLRCRVQKREDQGTTGNLGHIMHMNCASLQQADIICIFDIYFAAIVETGVIINYSNSQSDVERKFIPI